MPALALTISSYLAIIYILKIVNAFFVHEIGVVGKLFIVFLNVI